MGWNKQSGDAWVLQRSVVEFGEREQTKALALRVTSLLTLQDAENLARAILTEIQAARLSERAQPQISYGSAVLQHWDEVLGPENDGPPSG